MEDLTKEQWISAYEDVKKQDCHYLDKLLKRASDAVDGNESMKHAQAALNLTMAIQNKYSFMLPKRPDNFYNDDKQPG